MVEMAIIFGEKRCKWEKNGEIERRKGGKTGKYEGEWEKWGGGRGKGDSNLEEPSIGEICELPSWCRFSGKGKRFLKNGK